MDFSVLETISCARWPIVIVLSFKIFQESGDSSPSIILSKVVLPAPLGPTKPARIPRFKKIFTLENKSPLGYAFEILSRRIMLYETHLQITP